MTEQEIIIHISGGVIQDITTNIKNLKICIDDGDDEHLYENYKYIRKCWLSYLNRWS